MTEKKTGINPDPVHCPECGELMPRWRFPKNWDQAMFGGWTCHKCGVELDRWGDFRHAEEPPAPF